MISAYLCCSRVQLLVWKCFHIQTKLVVKWALHCQKLAAVGVRWTWGRVGGYWRSLGTNREDGGHWRSSAAKVGVGRVGSGAHYSGELPAATSGAPTSPLLKYLKQVLSSLWLEIYPLLRYLEPVLPWYIRLQILLSWQISGTNPLHMVKSNIWNKSSSHGKYLKKIYSSWWGQISEINPCLIQWFQAN